MRLIITLLMLPIFLAGCAGSGQYDSTKYKIQKHVAYIKYTAQNLKTAPCKQIDRAMAYSYALGFIIKSKTASGNKLNSLDLKSRKKLRSYYSSFRNEYKRRCKSNPKITKTFKKVYPELFKEAQRRKKWKNKLKKELN